MMQHPAGVDDVERARDVTELENVGLCILNVRDAQLLRLALAIADAAQAQVNRQYAGTAESRGHEDRRAARTAPGNKHLRRAVIRHWRKGRERQRAPQFGIEGRWLLAYWQFHPARVGILLILLAYVF